MAKCDTPQLNSNNKMSEKEAFANDLYIVPRGQTQSRPARAFNRLTKQGVNILLLKLAGLTYRDIQGYYPYSVRTLKRYIEKAKHEYPEVRKHL